jgi:hypothetical protein
MTDSTQFVKTLVAERYSEVEGIRLVTDNLKLEKNMTWEIYADLTYLSDFFNIPYERINELFKGLCSGKKRPDEVMKYLKEG